MSDRALHFIAVVFAAFVFGFFLSTLLDLLPIHHLTRLVLMLIISWESGNLLRFVLPPP